MILPFLLYPYQCRGKKISNGSKVKQKRYEKNLCEKYVVLRDISPF